MTKENDGKKSVEGPLGYGDNDEEDLSNPDRSRHTVLSIEDDCAISPLSCITKSSASASDITSLSNQDDSPTRTDQRKRQNGVGSYTSSTESDDDAERMDRKRTTAQALWDSTVSNPKSDVFMARQRIRELEDQKAKGPKKIETEPNHL
jgi:hypothetical protein